MNVLETDSTVSLAHRAKQRQSPRAWLPWLVGALIAAAGIGLRVVHWAGFSGRGFDEVLYAHYLRQLIAVGLGRYPDIVDGYLAYQKTIPGSILPPTRFLYIFCAYGWHGIFGGEPLAAFYAVSRVFSVLTLLLAGLFGRRLLQGVWAGLAVFAADGVFAPANPLGATRAGRRIFRVLGLTDALGALGKPATTPPSRAWLAVYTAGLAAMVTTKENAFFVFVAVLALLGGGTLVAVGTAVTRPLLVLTFIGPLDRRGHPGKHRRRFADAGECLFTSASQKTCSWSTRS